MSSPRPRRRLPVLLLLLLAGIGSAGALAGPASAAAPSVGWTCRAQSLTVSLAGASPLQQITNLLAAGSDDEACATHTNSPVGSGLKPVTDALAVLGVNLSAAQADTSTDVTKAAQDQAPKSHAKVTALDLSIAGTSILHADAIESTVQATCSAGSPSFTSSSSVGGLTVFGQPVDLNQPVTTISQGIAGLQLVVKLTPGSITNDQYGYTRRALRVEVIQNVGGIQAPLIDLGVGVANVTGKGAVCAAAASPTVGVPTVDGRTITSVITPPAGTTISACSFAVTPAGGTAKTVPGIYDATTGSCTAVLAPSDFPAGIYTATATATTAAGGAGTSSASPPFTLTAPATTAPGVGTPTLTGRTVDATLAPSTGTTIASCRFVLTPGDGGAAKAVAGTVSAGHCTASLPRSDFAPGAYAIKATATDSTGQVGEGSGTGTIAGPTVGTPVALGPLVGAPVTPGTGATVQSCTLTIRPAAGGTPQTIAGSFDAPSSTCAALLPAATYPSGDYDLTVTVVDSSGDSATNTGRVTVGQFVFGTAPGTGAKGAGGPATTADVGQALVACDGRKLTLTDVTRSGSRVTIAGVAQKALAGKTVLIRFSAKGRSTVVAGSVKVAADGTFSTSVKAPAAKYRTTKADGRYTGVIGSSASTALRLVRRMVFTSVVHSTGGTIRVSGRISAPLPRTRQTVVISRRTSCKAYRTVAKVKASSTGRFTATFKAPTDGSAGLYRASTKVPSKPKGAAKNTTFTLPRIIAAK